MDFIPMNMRVFHLNKLIKENVLVLYRYFFCSMLNKYFVLRNKGECELNVGV